jgi:hypothetical protein
LRQLLVKVMCDGGASSRRTLQQFLLIHWLHFLSRSLAQAEGAEQYRNKAVLVNLQSSNQLKENVTIDIPRTAVNDSYYIEISAVGSYRYKTRILPPITYYWTVPLILDHSYLFGKLTSSKIADTKVSRF